MNYFTHTEWGCVRTPSEPRLTAIIDKHLTEFFNATECVKADGES
jgi:hypothetical protein